MHTSAGPRWSARTCADAIPLKLLRGSAQWRENGGICVELSCSAIRPHSLIIGLDGGPACSPPCPPGRSVITRKMVGPTGMRKAETTDKRTKRKQETTIEPIAMRVPEACRYLGIGRSTLYVLIGEGEIEFIKLGSSTLILTESLRSLVEKRRTSSHRTVEIVP